ncbi:MAG: 23S rRNA (uracil(1939)-C(5))-methyltransferase RlmD, partial [Ruminococcaceae bacterium]|nr:23S rRNA (uracil(1939)-C(5))-methyltransferase RlmD [Oscillospiraceae bacterium]
MEKLREGKIYAGTVEGYSSEGLGIVRLDGAVVFVPQAIRGEEIEVKITKVMKTAAAGEIVKIRKPSPERVKPECPYYGRCGGCDFQHMSYTEELWAKRQRVQDALMRLGGTEVQVEEILSAKNPLGYRNKSQYPVGTDGTIGFFRARSHEVVSIDRCLIQSEISDKTAQAVRTWMKRYKISAYDERSGKGLVRHVYVRVNKKGESLCCVVVNGAGVPREPELAAYVQAAAPKTVGVLVNTNTRKGNVVLGDKYRTVWGQDYLMDSLCGLTFKLSVPSFYQVNREQAEVLYGKALEYAALTGEETVLDLYCGTGTITLCLAKQAKRAIGAEIVAPAIRDANENAERNGVKNVEFFCGDAADIAAKLEKEGLRPDVITVDPPRKGLAP